MRYIILSLTVFLFAGCSDFLEESSQSNDYVRTWKDLNELARASVDAARVSPFVGRRGGREQLRIVAL